MAAARISAVLNTLNEEANLPFALRSVAPWVDEIIVVDMQSTDRTVEIARQFGAQVYSHEPVGYADPARAFALSKATGDWVLILDADEVVPPALSRRLREIAVQGAVDVVRIPWRNYIFGVALSYTGWGEHQAKMTRFFRRGYLETTPNVHDYIRVRPDARLLELPVRPGESVLHFNYRDVDHFIGKLNRYTSIEAAQRVGRGGKSSIPGACLRAVREFLYRYVKAQGFRDGWRGLTLSLLMAFYRLATEAKIRLQMDAGTRAEIEQRYRREAEECLRGYEASIKPSPVAGSGRLN